MRAGVKYSFWQQTQHNNKSCEIEAIKMGPSLGATRDGHPSSSIMSLILVKSYLCFAIFRGSNGLPTLKEDKAVL